MAPTIQIGISPGKPKLLEQVRDVIRRKHYSFRTEQTYIDWIRRFILFHRKRHPNEMAEAEVTEFLTYLARERNVAASTQNQALSALLFLYKEVLQREIGWLDQVDGRGQIRGRKGSDPSIGFLCSQYSDLTPSPPSISSNAIHSRMCHRSALLRNRNTR